MGIKNKLNRQVPIAPLITFRICFGAIMLFSIMRFWLNGWISSQYINPKFYFTYPGFGWVHPLGATGMYVLFFVMGLAAFLVLIGLCYKPAIILFFLTFSYTELIDVTNYLNHYYFISIISFLLIFLPANAALSADVILQPENRRTHVPFWTIGVIRLQLGMVYFFAGIAKLNADWLLEAIPMKIWLPAKSHLPIIGSLMYEKWVAYLFSWFGAVYDLSIAFLLIQRQTRPYAYIAVIGFHICTAVVFPAIGMFPYVMMLSSLIFLSGDFHRRLLGLFTGPHATADRNFLYPPVTAKILHGMLCVFFVIQALLPMRFLLYPGPLFWYEEGYRFSWRVMLMEKSGNTFFYVRDRLTGRVYEVNNPDFLTPQQEKMMSTQPDMILRYAQYLKQVYLQRGLHNPAVYAEGYVALNGERSQPFIDTRVDLSALQINWKHVGFILPFLKTQH